MSEQRSDESNESGQTHVKIARFEDRINNSDMTGIFIQNVYISSINLN